MADYIIGLYPRENLTFAFDMLWSHSLFVVRDSTLQFRNVIENLRQSFAMRHRSLTIRRWFSMQQSNQAF